MLAALGAVDRLVTGPETSLLPVAQRHEAGVIAMKVYGHGNLQQRELALRSSLGLPGVSMAILGMDSQAQIEENVRLAEAVTPLTEIELDALLDEASQLVRQNDRPSDKSPIFWLFDIKSMAWKENSEPAMVEY